MFQKRGGKKGVYIEVGERRGRFKRDGGRKELFKRKGILLRELGKQRMWWKTEKRFD